MTRNLNIEYAVTYANAIENQDNATLKEQSKRLVKFCDEQSWITLLNIRDLKPPEKAPRSTQQLIKQLIEHQPDKLVFENRKSLEHIGVRYLRILCAHLGCELVDISKKQLNRG